MKSSEEKSLELTAAMRKFRALEEEMQLCLQVLRKYMRVERSWVFHPLSKEEHEEKKVE